MSRVPLAVYRTELCSVLVRGAERSEALVHGHEGRSMASELPYAVYVLLSEKDQKLYIGYSTDVEKRLKDHSVGKVPATRPRRPLKLIHCEYYLAKGDAVRRELYLKTTKGKRALKLMLRESVMQEV